MNTFHRQGIGVPAAVVSGLSAAHTAAGTFCAHVDLSQKGLTYLLFSSLPGEMIQFD